MRTGLSLRTQLLAALLVPAGTLLLGLGPIAVDLVGDALERAMAERLVAVAAAAAATQSSRVLALGPGDDDTRTKGHALTRLELVRERTKVARLLLVSLPEHRVLLDTAEQLPIGAPYHRAELDRPELTRVEAGAEASSLLFKDAEGRPYKTGYAPMRDDEGAVRAYVAAAASADYPSALEALEAQLLLGGGLGLASLALLAVALASRLTRPLARLSAAARAIGAGRTEVEIPVAGSLEVRTLGETMQRMARDLAAREEERQLMLAGIAHEVRNPLGGIELFGGLLREDLQGDPRCEHVDRIMLELGVLSAVVNDFLDFARRKDPEPMEVDLGELLYEVAALVEPAATQRGVVVEVRAEGRPLGQLDRHLVRRAALNLARNAVEAARARVRLSAIVEGSVVRLEVEDDGAGVSLDHRDKLFTPFFTTKQRGTGLGLALVARAVEAHRGQIAVLDSEWGGARFELALPAGS